MTSFNHYALGAVASFLHAVVGGLSPLEPGWRSALVKPQPGGTVASAKVDYDSPYGPYSVAWKLDREELKVKVEVPPNGSAKVVLPGVEETIGSGKREYSVKWAKNERWPPKLLPGPSSIQMPDEYIP
jgi:alpha-L-rhamnosidase